MKLDACPVEPPGFGNGPLSICTMSRQPSSARWPTTEFPTMPDPITTTFAVVGTSLTLVLLEVGGAGRTLSTRSIAGPGCRCAVVSRNRLAELVRGFGDVRSDGVDIDVARKAVARPMAMDGRDRRSACVDDRCRDGVDAVVELADGPHVTVAADAREPTLDAGGLGHRSVGEPRRRPREILVDELPRLGGEQHET